MMRPLLALAAVSLLGIGAGACGGVGKSMSSTPHALRWEGHPAALTATVPSHARSTHTYLNDGDAEKVDDHDGDNSSRNHEDGDADSSEEYEETYDNRRYHDSDDGKSLKYGHAAGAAEQHAISAVVYRYFAAAAADDGATGCTMMLSSFANSIPEDYGRGAGPVYLRGGNTCQAVMSLFFSHFHKRLAGAVTVTAARIDGNRSAALLGSSTMPANDIYLGREHGAWKISSLIGEALP